MPNTSATIAVLTDEYIEDRKLIIDQIARVLQDSGYQTLCIAGKELDPAPSFHQDYTVCNAIYTAARDYALDGVILLSTELASNSSIERIEKFAKTFSPVPLVSFGLELSSVPSVIVDETAAAYAMYDHVLAMRPASKLLFISDSDCKKISYRREQYFRHVAAKKGYADSAILSVCENDSAINTYETVTALLKEHPDIHVIAAANDIIAESAARAVHSSGLTIPTDVRVTGFGDTKESIRMYPAITTVRSSAIQAATQVANLMLQSLQDQPTIPANTTPLCINITAELVIRESTAGSGSEHLPVAQSKDELTSRLHTAMRGLEAPLDVDLTDLASSLWSTISQGSDNFDSCLKRFLHMSPPCVCTIHWWSNVSHQLQKITTLLHETQVPAYRIAAITAAVATVRQHVWTIGMAMEFEQQRMSSVRSTMQVQMSSCVKQKDILVTMERWLTQKNIKRCYLVRYNSSGPVPDKQAQLLQAYEDGVALPVCSDLFDACKLLPEHHLQAPLQGLLIQTPIYAGQVIFGYLLIDPSNIDYLHLDNAAQCIGNALRNQHLIKQLEQRTCRLQTTNNELVRLANYDELTELPNRLKFNTNLKKQVEITLSTAVTLTLFFIDLDGFKLVNDTLGHRAGDELLRQVALRLNSVIRNTIGDKGFIARLGGDEFTVTITGVNQRDRIEEIAEALLESLARPYTISKRTINISASIGMADLPATANNVETLVKNADSAMYRAKEKGKNRAAWYTHELSVMSDTFLQMDNDMRIALLSGDICMHYQPRINMSTGKLSAVEALMRWTIDTPDGRKTRTRPDLFIAVAERTGFITQLDTFALDESCRQAREWELAGTPVLVAVNISVLHLQQEDFVDTVLDTLARYQLSAHLLELEITESAVMTKIESNVEKLHCLRGYGIQLSIDDFGTGYSSLSYLKKLPANNLKIDKSFIADIDSSRMRRSADAAIIKSVIALGKSMDFQIIAEGIETEFQRQFLKTLGCHEAQGYLFAHPAPAAEITPLLDNGYLFRHSA